MVVVSDPAGLTPEPTGVVFGQAMVQTRQMLSAIMLGCAFAAQAAPAFALRCMEPNVAFVTGSHPPVVSREVTLQRFKPLIEARKMPQS